MSDRKRPLGNFMYDEDDDMGSVYEENSTLLNLLAVWLERNGCRDEEQG